MLLADEEQQLVELAALSRVEAGGRLVEAEQHRIGAHGARDLEAALLAVGQRAGGIVGACGEAGAVEPVARPLDRVAFRRTVRRQPDQPADGEARCLHQHVVLRHHQVLQRGHAGEQADVLEGARHARELCDAEVEQPLQQVGFAVGMFEPHHAGARRVEAGDAVEHGGLAGAVRPDQRGDLAALRREAQGVHRDQAAEPHGEVLDLEDGRAHGWPAPFLWSAR